MVARVVIGGTSSGAGKTSVSIAFCRALAWRGFRVQPFKAGPDFLDPTYLSLAAGRPCFNLDGWMMGRDYVSRLFDRASTDADIAVIEGVMGLFDGASVNSSEGSAAELALLLNASVLLVADAGGVARSFAATVHGFHSFEPDLQFLGVVANRVGSVGHGQWLAKALDSAPTKLPPFLGAIPRGAFPELPNRHLGLHSAGSDFVSSGTLDALALALEEHLDIDRLLDELQAPSPSRKTPPDREQKASATVRKVTHDRASIRIGIARDKAFHFYYCDILDALMDRGCELVDFSPIKDSTLPKGLHGVIFGGGYPELHAASLSANTSMLNSVRAFAESDRPIYGECGGLMYLCSELETKERCYPMVGLFDARTRMLNRFSVLRYVEVIFLETSLWGKAGQTVRGHEFHYSEIVGDPSDDEQCRRVYEVRTRRNGATSCEGFQLTSGQVLASYCHLHYGPHSEMIDHFVERCR